VTLVAAVVAGGGTLGGALAGLVRGVAACEETCQQGFAIVLQCAVASV